MKVSIFRKAFVFFFLLCSHLCFGQNWAVEFIAGTSAYNGDLTEQTFSFKRLRPAAGVNLKYVSGDLINARVGLSLIQLGADDKDNKRRDLQARNLSFKTNVIELSFCAEFNILDPEIYTQYPYLFFGAAIFHFNPYTEDKNNNKTFLHPLSTEGQGLSEYSDRKKYSLVQLCIPVGIGFKIKATPKWELSYEFGYRFLFTDYIDDVSKTYVSLEVLNTRKGPKAEELAYRKKTPFSEEGFPRGNSEVKDYFFFTGLKLTLNLIK